ncbi:hypothetical protein DFH08DRAFT_951003 [Mycena albidolilacea]|uniref:Uncharacterized protein n=1 Tax=Mycena albidolilacea TaxID=1033008 RepID=A0AAD7ANG0_9AGAR|nr:hypothetical protein DFH08DRAFT_951003 [Mycena albidolilacea]
MGLSAGKKAAAVSLALFFVLLLGLAHLKISRARGAAKRSTWSEKLNKRMSTISVDWKSMTPGGAKEAVHQFIAIGSCPRVSPSTSPPSGCRAVVCARPDSRGSRAFHTASYAARPPFRSRLPGERRDARTANTTATYPAPRPPTVLRLAQLHPTDALAPVARLSARRARTPRRGADAVCRLAALARPFARVCTRLHLPPLCARRGSRRVEGRAHRGRRALVHPHRTAHILFVQDLNTACGGRRVGAVRGRRVPRKAVESFGKAGLEGQIHSLQVNMGHANPTHLGQITTYNSRVQGRTAAPPKQVRAALRGYLDCLTAYLQKSKKADHAQATKAALQAAEQEWHNFIVEYHGLSEREDWALAPLPGFQMVRVQKPQPGPAHARLPPVPSVSHAPVITAPRRGAGTYTPTPHLSTSSSSMKAPRAGPLPVTGKKIVIDISDSESQPVTPTRTGKAPRAVLTKYKDVVEMSDTESEAASASPSARDLKSFGAQGLSQEVIDISSDSESQTVSPSPSIRTMKTLSPATLTPRLVGSSKMLQPASASTSGSPSTANKKRKRVIDLTGGRASKKADVGRNNTV